MSDEITVDTYKEMWEQTDLFVLVKTESDVLPYIPHMRTGIIYPVIPIHENVRQSVIRNMLEAGVEVLYEQPRLIEKELWTKRKHEFVLVEPLAPLRKYATKYAIFHKASGQALVNPNIYPDHYDEICKKMIEADVEVWSRDKWNEYRTQRS